MTEFRRRIGSILGVAIPDNDGFKQSFDELDRAGAMDQRKLLEILIELCKVADHAESREDKPV